MPDVSSIRSRSCGARGIGRLPSVLAMLVLAFTGALADAAAARTCHWWRDLAVLGDNGYARAFKLGYVAGFAQGAYLAIAEARSEEREVTRAIEGGASRAARRRLAAVAAGAEAARGPLDLAGFTIDQLVGGLDQLCADGRNEDVDVHEGLKIVRWRLDGRPAVEIDRELERMRSASAPGR